MLHTSHIELSEKALQNNISYMRDQMSNGARYSMVIKGNAYGHGIETIIPVAERCGIDHFSVFSVAEAIRAKKAIHPKCDIMILGWIDKEELEWAIINNVSFYVFTFDRLTAACKTAKKLKRKARIHLELETGMHRTGFSEKEMDKMFRYVRRYSDQFTIEGICTHYAGAESINNYTRIREQIRTFNDRVHLAIKGPDLFTDPGIVIDRFRPGIMRAYSLDCELIAVPPYIPEHLIHLLFREPGPVHSCLQLQVDPRLTLKFLRCFTGSCQAIERKHIK